MLTAADFIAHPGGVHPRQAFRIVLMSAGRRSCAVVLVWCGLPVDEVYLQPSVIVPGLLSPSSVNFPETMSFSRVASISP